MSIHSFRFSETLARHSESDSKKGKIRERNKQELQENVKESYSKIGRKSRAKQICEFESDLNDSKNREEIPLKYPNDHQKTRLYRHTI